jgi:glycosyltransferase involved in cell wall biosynthesis
MKILFISHDASRTGAPILLLGFLKWLENNTDIHFDVILINGGVLENEFKKLTNIYYWQVPPSKPIGLKQQIYNRIFNIEHNPIEEYTNNLFQELKTNNYDLIYGNTVVSSSIIPQILKHLPNAKIILHVHELLDITSNYSNKLIALSNFNIQYIAVSQITLQNLITNHNVSPNKIALIYEYINTAEVLTHTQKKIGTKFIINASGVVQMRKGYDIFVLIAKRAVQKYPKVPFHFKWIGRITDDIKFYLENDIKQAGLETIVDFIGELESPYAAYAESDVFLMPSRQDPFPLVAIEHALLEKPIICFDKVTGIPEFVENDAGIIVPYLDIEAMVDALYLLYSNDEMRNKFGKTASIKALNFDINIQAKKILDILND